MATLNVKLRKHNVEVPCVLRFDFDSPESSTGYRGALGLINIEDISPADAREILRELIEDKVERELWQMWDAGDIDGVKSICL